TTAVNSVQPGDTIRVTANISSGISIKNKTASESNPIYIVAANPQQTTLYSLTVDNCQGIVVQGFKFGPNTAGVLMKVVNSKYIKILRNYFDHNNISTSQSTIVTTQASQYIEVAYNLFDRKNVGTVSGSYIKTQYDAPNVTKNMYIHHNHFKNIVPMPSGDTFDGDSDREAIVLGISSTQDIMTDHIIEYNLFEDCDGENEIITVKTSRNIIRYNTFKNCLGSVSVRFGTQTEVYGNFFIGVGASASINDPNYETGGIRVYGSYHKVYNNYMQGLTGTSYRVPLCLDGGDTSDSSGGDGHERPTYCEFTNNTIVNCAWGIGVGTHYSLSPQNCKISNNIISNSQNQLFVLTRCDSTNTFEGNIAWPTGSASLGTSKTQNEIWQTNPYLTTVGDLQKLTSTSPAINYSKGSYTYINDDMDGQSRMSVNDAGADEYSTAPVTRRPLTSADVGYNAP
ncbi:MAG: chondroitinase-B domain-containing protein, partial [Bacteroidota bacterium]